MGTYTSGPLTLAVDDEQGTTCELIVHLSNGRFRLVYRVVIMQFRYILLSVRYECLLDGTWETTCTLQAPEYRDALRGKNKVLLSLDKFYEDVAEAIRITAQPGYRESFLAVRNMFLLMMAGVIPAEQAPLV